MRKSQPKKMALCHPDKVSVGRGLCKPCWWHDYYMRNKVSIAAKAKAKYDPIATRTYYEANRDRIIERQREYRAKNRDVINTKLREGWFKWTYGITEAEYLSMLEAQDGLCAICRQAPTPRRRRRRLFCIDHCHVTGKIRGLLCDPCNLALAHMRDNPDNLQSAIEYLERAQ